MLPPINCTSRSDIARPRPVEPARTFCAFSPFSNGWNSFSCILAEMPLPLSLTAKRTVQVSPTGPAASMLRSTSPLVVNLFALPTRFNRTCRMRSLSPTIVSGNDGSIMTCIRLPFSFASTAATSATSCASVASEKAPSLSGSFPASSRVRSRISLMSVNSPSDARKMVPSMRLSSPCSFCFSNNSDSPMIALSGVRMSWLIIARNSDFAPLAVVALRASSFIRSACASECSRSLSKLDRDWFASSSRCLARRSEWIR